MSEYQLTSVGQRNLTLMEEVLRRIRETLVEHDLADKISARDMLCSSETKFSKLYLSGEPEWDWQVFYRSRGDYSGLLGWGTAGPKWVRLYTEDRLAWGHAIPYMLASLQGLPISLVNETSWRWDTLHPQSNGQPTYIPQYQVMIVLAPDGGVSFKSTQAIKDILATHCMARHRLADRSLFQWQESEFDCKPITHYGWTPSGFQCLFDSKQELDEACQMVLSGLSYVVDKSGKGSTATWTITVDLTGKPA